MSQQMEAIDAILESLQRTPDILEDLISRVPADDLRARRETGKWSVHEQVCHLAATQQMLNQRAQGFIDQEHPSFEPYDPDEATPDRALEEMDFEQSVASFRRDRGTYLDLLRTLVDEDWDRTATHPEYKEYTPLILARHTLLHDHFHLYRIEEAWLTA